MTPTNADRLPFAHKVAYGVGGFVNNTLAAAISGMLIILNLGFGMSPALVGLVAAVPRAFDALIDPLMGFTSDRTRSRWGRRRPYIFCGALAVGAVFALLWMIPPGRTEQFYFWYFVVGSVAFYAAYTVFAAPWVALGYELTPDYHERTRLMGVQNFIGQIAYLISPWFLWFMSNRDWFATITDGARALGWAVGATVAIVGIIPALVLRERSAALRQTSSGGLAGAVREFASGFSTTLRSRPFLRLALCALLVFNGFTMIASFQAYVIIYYVFAGDQSRGATFAGYAGTTGALSAFVAISLVTWLGTRLGKKQALFVSTGISALGHALKWFCYDPRHPWLVLLPMPLIAFGLGGLFTLVGSMIADVVDVDELSTQQRREGMYGSTFWWIVKIGMSAALAGGGALLELTGFDVALGGGQSTRALWLMRVIDVSVPVITSLLALWVMHGYPITEAQAHDVRRTLEARRTSLATGSAA